MHKLKQQTVSASDWQLSLFLLSSNNTVVCVQLKNGSHKHYCWENLQCVTSVKLNDPSTHPWPITIYPLQGHGWSWFQLTLGDWQRTQRIGRQFTTWLTHRDRQTFKLTFTPTGNSESPINLTCTLGTVGGNRSSRRKPTQTQEKYANCTQKDLSGWRVHFEPTVLTTDPACSHI